MYISIDSERYICTEDILLIEDFRQLTENDPEKAKKLAERFGIYPEKIKSVIFLKNGDKGDILLSQISPRSIMNKANAVKAKRRF